MSKNLEELKKIEDKISKLTLISFGNQLTYIIERMVHCLILTLEDFEKRLKRIEVELGIYTEEEIKKIKVGGTDPD